MFASFRRVYVWVILAQGCNRLKNTCYKTLRPPLFLASPLFWT